MHDGVCLRYMKNRTRQMRCVFKIYDAQETPNKGACLRYMMNRNEGACLRYMMSRVAK